MSKLVFSSVALQAHVCQSQSGMSNSFLSCHRVCQMAVTCLPELQVTAEQREDLPAFTPSIAGRDSRVTPTLELYLVLRLMTLF